MNEPILVVVTDQYIVTEDCEPGPARYRPTPPAASAIDCSPGSPSPDLSRPSSIAALMNAASAL